MIIGNPISTGLGDALYVLTIITAPGATVTAVLDDQTILKTANSLGVAVLRFRKEGTWTVTATDGTNTKVITVEVSSKKAETIMFFPAEPSAYTLIGKYTSLQTWTAPEDGWFQVEVFGASGKGGNSATEFALLPDETLAALSAAGGGGGGGGAYACSRVKLLAGDTIIFGGSIAIGGTATVVINGSLENYDTIATVSGKNGGNGKVSSYLDLGTGGSGGTGGTASGGNYKNINGEAGTTGQTKKGTKAFNLSEASGGASGHIDGNAGGVGGGTLHIYDDTGSAGSKAFVKIYRGDTNVVA